MKRVRILHIQASSVRKAGLRFHGSSKDIACRREYFSQREVEVTEFFHTRTKSLQEIIGRHESEAYTHIIVDGSFQPGDLHFARHTWPDSRIIARSHNSEVLHRIETYKATRRLGHLAKDREKVRASIRVYAEREAAVAANADWIISIEPESTALPYWRSMGFRGSLASAPYFLATQYLPARAADELPIASREKVVVCLSSPLPGPLMFEALINFHSAVSRLDGRKSGWRFLATGEFADWFKAERGYSDRVEHTGLVSDPLVILRQSRAMALLSDLGRGFKTKILDAIVSGAWVFVTPELSQRLPEVVRPYCLLVDIEDPNALDRAIEEMMRRSWPLGDPNEALRRQAFDALDRAIFGPDLPNRAAPRELSRSSSTLQTSASSYSQDTVQSSNSLSICAVGAIAPESLWLNLEVCAALNTYVPTVIVDDDRLSTLGSKYAAVTTTVKVPTIADVIETLCASADGLFVENSEQFDLVLENYQRAYSVISAFRQVTTRFAISVHPDFFIIRPNWLEEVVGHMLANDLAAFGACWHPRCFQKYRYFPSLDFLVLDLQRFNWREELLRPDLLNERPFISTFWRKDEVRQGDKPARRRYLVRHIGAALSEDLRQRRTVGSMREAGYRLKAEFADANNGLKVETLNPVFLPRDRFSPDAVTIFQRHPAIEALLPDSFSYTPKRPGYSSSIGFSDLGYPDFRARRCEEFMWQSEPFGFRLRRDASESSTSVLPEGVADGINVILERFGRKPIAKSSR